MRKFKAKDRVLVTKHSDATGMLGTVVKVDSAGDVLVAVDGYTNGHHGDLNDGSNDKAWFFSGAGIEIAAQQGPVRTVTRQEIAPGLYGRVEVSEYAKTAVTHVGVRLEPMGGSYAAFDATELRAAAIVFNQLADALEQKP